MRSDAVTLEEARVGSVETLDDYQSIHERHRIFPSVFENRNHHSIIDLSAGVGVVAKRICDHYNPESGKFSMTCNEMSPTCLELHRKMGIPSMSMIRSFQRVLPLPMRQGFC